MELKHVRIDLRRLILLFVPPVSIATLANSFFAAYRVQRQELVENALEYNQAYAAKVASTIEEFIHVVQQKLAYSATFLGTHFDDPDFVRAETKRLKEQDPDFNSITISGANGRILAVMPQSLQLTGRTLDSIGAQEALKARRPLISNAYRSIAGNLVIFISSPIHTMPGATTWAGRRRHLPPGAERAQRPDRLALPPGLQPWTAVGVCSTARKRS